MKRKYLYNNILDNGFELFGDIKYEDDYFNEYEEEEDYEKNINKDIEDIDRLVNELGILEEEENEDTLKENSSDDETYSIKDKEIFSDNTFYLGFIGIVFVTNIFILLHYSQEYDKWEETNQKYLLTW
jgi:hypothetical protein